MSRPLPLFPLHTVLCPGIALPLHVFEPRYRTMVERCLEEDEPFGVVLIREGREVGAGELAIAGVGTFAEIRQAERLPDGRYDLLVVGAGRFAVDTVDTEREPYVVADVTPLDDEVGDEDLASDLADRAMRRFVGYLRLLQPIAGETAEPIDVRIEVETADPAGEAATEPAPPTSAGERSLLIPDDPTVLSYLLSGIVQVDLRERQHLLEAETTLERLAMLDAILDRELWMLERRLRMFVPPSRVDAVRAN